jgi:hypothetical protein
VARWLDAEGVKGPGGGRWWPRTLGVWIRNPANFGYRCEYEDRKRRTHGKVLHRIAEPLADAALWKRANDRLDKVPGKRRPVNPASRAMLAGVIFCPRCADSPMYRIRAACGLFYRCTGRGANRKGCGNMVPLEVADAALRHIAEMTFRWRKVVVTTRIPGSNHEAELAGVAFELKQLGADFAAERIGDEEYAERFAALVAERKQLKALPAVPDRWENVELDETYADRWAALQPSERGPWLAGAGIPRGRHQGRREAVPARPPEAGQRDRDAHRREGGSMTGTDPYDAPLSTIRGRVDDLGAWLAIWEARHEPDAHARHCASDAVDAIDAALHDLHALRSRLVGEIRAGDDATAARADALLARGRSAGGQGAGREI